MLVCCYLSAVGKRRAYKDFGYSSITDLRARTLRILGA